MAGRPSGWQVKPGLRLRLAFAVEGQLATGEPAVERLLQLGLRGLTSRPAGDRWSGARRPEAAILS